jgi:hypothetical protein
MEMYCFRKLVFNQTELGEMKQDLIQEDVKED